MNKVIEESFEKDFKNKYNNIFLNCKPYNNQGINETNLTVNFSESLKKQLGDDSISLFEIKLKEEKMGHDSNTFLKNSRIDGVVYSKNKNSVFFIESKKFKRSQDKKYGNSLSNDINRLLNVENRQKLINDMELGNNISQYLVFLFDHWNEDNSRDKVDKWIAEEVNSLREKGFQEVQTNYIPINNYHITNEEYLIFKISFKV